VNAKHRTYIGCWNTRTLYEISKATQLAKDMKKYNIEVLGISESRWTGNGEIKLATGETIIYSGHQQQNAVHSKGVAFLMSDKATKALIAWEPISKRIIKARFKSICYNITVVNVYAPTNDAEYEEKLMLYEQLQSIINKVNKRDILILMEDMNAKIGNNNDGMECVMGKEGVGKMNENGAMLVNFCM
jgi:exonuclease III